jgi:phosphoadenosine phosphosulfate reductase
MTVGASALQPPALWTVPPYSGTVAALEAKAQALLERLEYIAARHSEARFASSLAAEDMVVTDAILRGAEGVRQQFSIFTLQTGRLHAETLAVLDAIQSRYTYTVARYAPTHDDVERFVAQYGLNGFYESVDARKACCGVRKVAPLNRALDGALAWLTGQRREQAVSRADLPFEELDAARGIPKYNPLTDWTEAEVWAYLHHYQVPVNALHAKGYPSIGCEPCTRAVRSGEDVRAGRWWWESQDTKECGLHEQNLKTP